MMECKPQGMGVPNWIHAWLKDSKQSCHQWYNFSMGKWPQWCPAGINPKSNLFIIYINDIDENIQSSLLKFPDNNKLVKQDVELCMCHIDEWVFVFDGDHTVTQASLL